MIGSQLSIPARQLESTGTVTVAAVDDEIDGPDRTVEVTASVSGVSGLSAPASQTLTITDDEPTPEVTLVLTPASISEDGGESLVTARLSGATSEEVTVTVTASAVVPADAEAFTLSENRALTIEAGQLESTGTVTLSAVDDEVDGPDRMVEVTASVSGASGLSAPASQTLTITDDESTPTVTLVLMPDEILEWEGESRVTAQLSGATSEEVTLTVTASAVAEAEAFTLGENRELTIEAGETESTGTVTIWAVNDEVYGSDRTVEVTASVSGVSGVADPASQTLTIVEDEPPPTVTLVLQYELIQEGGETLVTARLSGATSEEVTLTVTAEAVVPADAEAFTLSENRELTIAAGETESTGTVRVEAVNNEEHDDPDREVTVAATVTGPAGLQAPSARTVTIAAAAFPSLPTLTLSTGPVPLPEGHTHNQSLYARLSHALAQDTIVTLSWGGTAVENEDYYFEAPLPREISIPANELVGEIRFLLVGIVDGVDEVAEAITVSGQAPGVKVDGTTIP